MIGGKQTLDRLQGVCILITDIDAPTGGVQNQTRRLAGELHRRGISTYVCVRNYHRRQRDEVQDGHFIHRCPVVNRSAAAVNSMLYLMDGLTWLVRHRARYDVIHCQQMFGPAMLGVLAKKLLRKPVLVRVTSTGELGEVGRVRRMPLSRVRLRQLQRVDRWVALTTDMAAEIRSLGVASDRINIIPNSAALPQVAAHEFGVRQSFRTSIGLTYPQIAVFSGRLSREKGLDTLLFAWELLRPQHPEAHLLLLGSGGEFRNVEAELRDLCRHLDLQSVVHFLGHVPNVGEYLLASDVFVLPTRSEGMSNALVEAMAAGTAIVTTDIPANRDLVEDGHNALLVQPDDAEELAAAISRILADQKLKEALGAAARQRAERDLSVEAMASRYLSLYSSLVTA